ncbi:hypothetical protein PPYR_08177 [Photinus pyralis]|uniref:Uncharacterized protein n=1 Tax=Photinus pyralis TaxID=7054 RepID=A0A5N4AIQ9_PHOPY|nr:uncharacterized protein LOC116172226 isoform X1 [Photinus pyralis]KAB0797183.1 hypothetical protein PPYR_08177 [Photinus pyralis]
MFGTNGIFPWGVSHSCDRSPFSSSTICMQCPSPMHPCACPSIRKPPLTLEQHIVCRQLKNDWLELKQIQKTIERRPPHDDCALTINWPECSTNLFVENRVNLPLAHHLRMSFKSDVEDTKGPMLFTRKRLALKKTPDLQWQPKWFSGNAMENEETLEVGVTADLAGNGTSRRERRKKDKKKSAYLLAYEFSDSSVDDSCEDYGAINKY